MKSCALPETVVGTCSLKKCVFKNFLGKHLCRSPFFDKAAGWNFCTGFFLCIFQNIFWSELANIFLLLVDIFCCCCYWWCCHIKSSLNTLGRCKTVFMLSAAIFQNICIRFTEIWLFDNFFSRESVKEVENSQLFFSLIFFIAVFQMSRLHMLSSKIKRNFLPARKF